jgi:uncharacterized protein YpuA (DUF1002 family)
MKKYIKQLLIALITVSLLMQPIMVKADESKIVTLGADLSNEQRELILNYFGVNEDEVAIITVTNADEHELLDDIATQQQIGSRTYSCTYIEPTESGGIHIKTVNLNWVTCEMIRNALVTSGIVNCNVIAAAPFEVSGTGAITGVFKAYEEVSGEELEEDKKELASEELITTCDIAGTVGQEEASTMVSDLKSDVITQDLEDEDDILDLLNKYLEDNNIELTEEQKWQLVELLLKISKQDYDIDEVKQAYADIQQTVADTKEKVEETKTIIGKICDFFTNLYAKITGTYEEVKESDEYQSAQEQLGILLQTNDSLLGDDTIVTATEEIATDTTDNEEEQTTTENTEETQEKHWYDFILKLFNNGNKKDDEVSTTTKVEDNLKNASKFTFDSFKNNSSTENEEENTVSENSIGTDESSVETEQQDEQEQQEKQDDGMLNYVTYDIDSEDNANTSSSTTTAPSVKSFDEITE